MFKKMRIRNFKGIDELCLDFSQMNVLIGANSSGKSTIIQAIDLLVNSVSRDVPEYLSSRGWDVSGIKCQLLKSRFISFFSHIYFEVDKQPVNMLWDIEFTLTQKDNSVKLHSEKLIIVHKKLPDLKWEELLQSEGVDSARDTLFSFYDGAVHIIDNGKVTDAHQVSMVLSSSFLKVLRLNESSKQYKYVEKLLTFLRNSMSFETLSTDKLRHSSRGKTLSIGRGGERLAAFIKQLDPSQKDKYYRLIKDFVPHVDSIEAITKGKPGWIELYLNESYGNNNLRISPPHVSDGTLRILALVSLLEHKMISGLIILDEIENGINPHIASEIVKLLYLFIHDSGRQMIVTTHSSLMLDDFTTESIIYVSRTTKGAIRACRIFDREELTSMLEYLSPGEIWINTSEQELLGFPQQDS